MSGVERPLGVTILGVLGIVGSVLCILLGIGLAFLGIAFFPAGGEFAQFLGGFVGIIGMVIIVMGVLSAVLSWGLLNGKYWAWLITLILEVLGVISSLGLLLSAPFFALFSLAIPVVVIWYLLQPHVRAYFEGRRAPTPTYVPPPPPPIGA